MPKYKFVTPKEEVYVLLSLKNFIERLSKRQLEVFRYLVYDEIGIPEMAVKMGLQPKVVSRTITNTHQKVDRYAKREVVELFNKALANQGLRTNRKWYQKPVKKKGISVMTNRKKLKEMIDKSKQNKPEPSS